MEEYRREMAGVYTTSVNEATIDETPMASQSYSIESFFAPYRYFVYGLKWGTLSKKCPPFIYHL